jgi:hypothetical protein
MTQQLDFDFSQEPKANPDYFFPLSMRLDAKEKQEFIDGPLKDLRTGIEKNSLSLVNTGNADQYFQETIKATNDFLAPLGVKSRALTLFMSSKNQTSWVVHRDGTRFQGDPVVLEARLSYYEIAESPGAIRWWDDSVDTVLKEYEKTQFSQYRTTAMTSWAEKIRDDELTWDDVPAPAFAVVTSSPSALLRTNRPHHVIQGPGLRVTVSSQLVFLNGDPTGIWRHIQNNKHLIGV